jgi:hypothetical protein
MIGHSHALTRGIRSLAFEPADEGKGVKLSLNVGSLAFKGGAAHQESCKYQHSKKI